MFKISFFSTIPHLYIILLTTLSISAFLSSYHNKALLVSSFQPSSSSISLSRRRKITSPSQFIQRWKNPLSPLYPKCTSKELRTSTTSTPLKMGLSINIRIVGRKNSIESTSFLQESYQTYSQRLTSSSSIDLTTTFHKSNQELLKNLQVDSKKGYGIICLDEQGSMYTSIEFSTKVYTWFEEYGSRLVFVIGAAEGLPVELKQYRYQFNNNSYKDGILNRPPMFMSLSKMTFTHPWARSILVEQIYRASEIHKGSGYHKE